MNADRDVIFVNQRGTLHSDPHLGCPEMDEFSFSRNKPWRSKTRRPQTSMPPRVAACKKSPGADRRRFRGLQHQGERGRYRRSAGKKLSIDQWNVYGVSYGTDLAQQLLRDHRTGIRSVVLDSVVPTSFNIIDHWWEAPASGLAAIFRAVRGPTRLRRRLSRPCRVCSSTPSTN